MCTFIIGISVKNANNLGVLLRSYRKHKDQLIEHVATMNIGATRLTVVITRNQ